MDLLGICRLLLRILLKTQITFPLQTEKPVLSNWVWCSNFALNKLSVNFTLATQSVSLDASRFGGLTCLERDEGITGQSIHFFHSLHLQPLRAVALIFSEKCNTLLHRSLIEVVCEELQCSEDHEVFPYVGYNHETLNIWSRRAGKRGKNIHGEKNTCLIKSLYPHLDFSATFYFSL